MKNQPTIQPNQTGQINMTVDCPDYGEFKNSVTASQQKNRLSILQGNIIYCATQLLTFHKEHLVTIHQWRCRDIIKSEEEKAIIERWQQLSFNHDEAKREALKFKLELSCIRKYQKKKKESADQIPIVVSEYSTK